MTLDDFALLTDENIHADVVTFLRRVGFDVLDVCEEGLRGTSDLDRLRRAFSEDRVVVTHDRDFGTLAVLAGEPVIGIAYLRPGHIDPTFTSETLQAILGEQLELTPPFIVVARRDGTQVTIRVRGL